MPIRRGPLAVVLALLLLPVVAGVARAGDPGWLNICGFSHRLHDDPIMHHGMPGMSHSHDFFGNVGTDARSTPRSLAGATTTCEMAADRAAYWMPTAYVHGVAILPVEVRFYYKTNTTPLSAVKPFPAGLRMIGGDHEATKPPPTSVVSWNCGQGSDMTHPSDCGAERQAAHVKFPNCWDGVRRDSADHMSHMAYPRDGHCSKSHPVPVPRLIIRIEWAIHDGRALRFASGSSSTLHADFVNAWSQSVLKRLVRECINAGVDCGHASGAAPNPVPVGPNLVGNAGFETSLRGWSAVGPGRLRRVEAGHDGRWAAQASMDRAGSCGIRDEPSWVATSRPGRYRTWLWVRGTDGGDLRVLVREWQGGSSIGAEVARIRLSSAWRRVFVDYVPQAPGASRLAVSATTPVKGAGACLKVDDASIRRSVI